MGNRIALFIPLFLFFCLTLGSPLHVSAQAVSKNTDSKKEWELNSPTKYYRVADLRIASADSINKFPHPAHRCRTLDSKHTKIVVRFPELGLLGITEDTIRSPTHITGDTLSEYKSHLPIYMLTFPKTEYFLFIDVWSKDGTKLLDSRPFEAIRN